MFEPRPVEASHVEPPRSFGPDIYCPSCSYNLFGTTSDKCSECGYDLSGLRNPEPLIPWVRDRQRDRYLAYWKTVFLVTFRPRRFAEAYAGKLRISDARKFQLVTALHVYLPILVSTLFVYATTPAQWGSTAFRIPVPTIGLSPPPSLADLAYEAIWPVVVWHCCGVLFLLTSTGIPNYFFHPRSVSLQQQDNGIAMSTYACAPLALISLLALLVFGVGSTLSPSAWGVAFVLTNGWALTILAIPPSLCVLAWWWQVHLLARRLMPDRRHRHVALGVVIPVGCLLLAALFLVTLPLIVLYVVLIVTSLLG